MQNQASLELEDRQTEASSQAYQAQIDRRQSDPSTSPLKDLQSQNMLVRFQNKLLKFKVERLQVELLYQKQLIDRLKVITRRSDAQCISKLQNERCNYRITIERISNNFQAQLSSQADSLRKEADLLRKENIQLKEQLGKNSQELTSYNRRMFQKLEQRIKSQREGNKAIQAQMQKKVQTTQAQLLKLTSALNDLQLQMIAIKRRNRELTQINKKYIRQIPVQSQRKIESSLSSMEQKQSEQIKIDPINQ